jgi:hypothetical protein
MTKLGEKAHLDEVNNKNKQNTLSLLTCLLEHIQKYNDVIDVTEDDELSAIFEYQRKVAKEQVAMLTEWMRRNDKDFQKSLSVYLFSEKPLVN